MAGRSVRADDCCCCWRFGGLTETRSGAEQSTGEQSRAEQSRAQERRGSAASQKLTRGLGGGLGAGWARVEINVAMAVNFVVYSGGDQRGDGGGQLRLVYSAMGPVRRRRRPASCRSSGSEHPAVRHGRIWEGWEDIWGRCGGDVWESRENGSPVSPISFSDAPAAAAAGCVAFTRNS